MVVSAEAKAYKRQAKLGAVRLNTNEVIERGNVSVYIVLHPKRPKRATGAPVRCMDLDNAQKIALDALQGIAYANDRQITEINIRRGDPVDGGALVICWEAAK